MYYKIRKVSCPMYIQPTPVLSPISQVLFPRTIASYPEERCA